MALQDILRKIQENITNYGVGVATLELGDAIYTNVPQFHSFAGRLRQAHRSIIPLAYSIISSIGNLGLPGTEESLTIGLASALDGAYRFMVAKEPFAYAPDNKTIEVFNLEASKSITLYIDGVSQTGFTPTTTDANGNAKISLPTELASGKHDVIVIAGKKAVYTVIVV